MKSASNFLLLLPAALMLAGCDSLDAEPPVVGLLERDRISLTAESNDPIVEIAVTEGAVVDAGQLIVRQDAARLDQNLARLVAEAEQAQAKLDEVLRGPREESIRAAEARLKDVRSRLAEANATWQRTAELRQQGLASAAELDSALQRKESAAATVAAARADLDAMLEGSTVEQLAQARAAVNAARAAVEELEIHRQRLTLEAPLRATVEALPFETGERPAPGQSVALLLASGQPHAVVFIPAMRREDFTAGTAVTVRTDEFGDFPGRVRYVASEAAFTPYYSLTQRERGRLSYRAEIDLPGDAAAQLPAGIPVEVLPAPRDAATQSTGDPDSHE